MPRSKRQDGRQPAPNGEVAVPAGAPAWITAQLLQATIETWQPHYERPLTPEDALEILLNVDRLLAFLEDSGVEKDRKEIPRVGPRLQP
jgi:hypothetical protein